MTKIDQTQNNYSSSQKTLLVHFCKIREPFRPVPFFESPEPTSIRPVPRAYSAGTPSLFGRYPEPIRPVLEERPSLFGRSRLCMDLAWNMHGFCMDYDGICMEHAWIIHGISMDYAWNMHGLCMGCA